MKPLLAAARNADSPAESPAELESGHPCRRTRSIRWQGLLAAALLLSGAAWGQTTVSVTAPANGATFPAGANITLSASVTPAAGTTITKVEFRRDGSNTLIGSATAAPWQFTWANAPAGLYAVSAVAYDTAPNNTASSAVSVQVGSPLLVQITTPAAGAVFAVGGALGYPVTGTATRDGVVAPIASMRFYINGTQVGTVSAAPYTWTWYGFTPGTYALEVRAYEANGSYTQSSPITVTAQVLPVIYPMLAPAMNSSLQLPGSVTLGVATTAPGSGYPEIAKVDFLANGIVVGTTTTGGAKGYWTVVWTPSLAGSYTLSARATDTLGRTNVTPAPPLAFTVVAGPTTISVTSPANNQRFTAPATIPLSATVGGGGAAQSLAFYQGNTLIGQGTSQGNNAFTLSWPAVPAGTYSVTARSTTPGNVTTSSAAVTVVVDAVVLQSGMYFVETDHLNTPRRVSNMSQQVVWRWDTAEPFGDTPPIENPSNLGTFEFNPRFPGQYRDKETNLAYNFYRDYDPMAGRYVQSDPIGLAGGINTYTYVGGNPLSRIDPEGLQGVVPGPGGLPLPIIPPSFGTESSRPSDPFEPGPRTTSPQLPSFGLPTLPPFLLSLGIIANAAINACKDDAEECRRKCDVAYNDQIRICKMSPTAKGRAQCYERAADLYAQCLKNCK